jgi:hypothetical protein
MANAKPEVGQVYRDTYYDGKDSNLTKRMIKIAEILDGAVRAEVLTMPNGSQPKGTRYTALKFKTLRAGYEIVGAQS